MSKSLDGAVRMCVKMYHSLVKIPMLKKLSLFAYMVICPGYFLVVEVIVVMDRLAPVWVTSDSSAFS